MARKIILKDNGINNQTDAPSGYKYLGYDDQDISEKSGATVSAIGGSTLPYTIYSCTLIQTGTNDPVATVLENTLSGTPVWTRTSTGLYYLTLNGEFSNANKLVISTPQPRVLFSGANHDFYSSNRIDNNIIFLQSTWTSNTTGLITVADGVMWSATHFEIKVYE
jgi:hypothetical protein